MYNNISDTSLSFPICKNLIEKVSDSIENNTPKYPRIPSIVLQNLLPLITTEIEVTGYLDEVDMYYWCHQCWNKFYFSENFDWSEYNKWFYSMEDLFVAYQARGLKIKGELKCTPGGAETFREMLPRLTYTIENRFIFITSRDYVLISSYTTT